MEPIMLSSELKDRDGSTGSSDGTTLEVALPPVSPSDLPWALKGPGLVMVLLLNC